MATTSEPVTFQKRTRTTLLDLERGHLTLGTRYVLAIRTVTGDDNVDVENAALTATQAISARGTYLMVDVTHTSANGSVAITPVCYDADGTLMFILATKTFAALTLTQGARFLAAAQEWALQGAGVVRLHVSAIAGATKNAVLRATTYTR